MVLEIPGVFECANFTKEKALQMIIYWLALGNDKIYHIHATRKDDRHPRGSFYGIYLNFRQEQGKQMMWTYVLSCELSVL